MLDLIVLGELPGTNIQLGFIPVMIMFEIGLITYLIKKHPAEIKKAILAIKTVFSKKKNRALKSLHHFRHDVLGPKLKFLK